MERDQDATLPLTSAQREMWFAQSFLADVPFTITQYTDVTGHFDRAVYAAAARYTARELGVYLTFGADAEGTPWQRLRFDQYDEVDFLDLSAEPDPHAAALAWMRADRGKPADVTVDAPIWSTVLRIGRLRHLVYTRAHHLVLDGYGAMTLGRRHAQVYEAMLDGAELPPPTLGSPQVLLDADRAYRESARFDTDRRYWAGRVADLPEAAGLATRPGDPAAYSVVIGADLDAAALGDSDGGSAAVLIASLAAYLARVTGAPEVTLSLPVAARTTAALRRAAGLVSNVVPLRLPLADTARLADLTAAVRAELSGALRHQRYRGEEMTRDAGADGTRYGARDFGPAVNIMNFQSSVGLGPAHGTLHVLGTGPVPDLALNIYPGSPEGIRVEFEGNPNRYTPAELAAHHARFLRLVDHLVGDPSATVGGFDLLDEEQRRTTVPWRGQRAVPAETLASLISAAVARNPDGTAVVFDESRWSYQDFDLRTDALARALIAAGAGPERLVVTMLDRSAESVAAVWAVAKSGAAFVPIDPGYPDERIEYVLADSGAEIALTTAEYAGRLPSRTRVILFDDLLATPPSEQPGPVTDAERTASLSPAHPAYLIYTSGSTGRPKGVTVTHGGLANLAAERRDRYDLRPGAVTLHHASPGFDMAVGEHLCALAGAATLVVAPRFVVAGSDLAELMRGERVSNAIITPAVLATLDPATLPDLKVLGVGGEAIRSDLVDAWAPGRLMRNGYGPTEATDIATIGELVEGRTPTIGAPLRGFHAVVLDTALRPVPPGVLGELYIGGPALARGYHGRAALTSGRFVADPFGPPGGRLYRTGDLVTIAESTAGPALLYHGRGDLQIKVRGHRIEPGEVETVLTSLPGVAGAAVTAHTDARTGTHLVAYLVPEPGRSIVRPAVRAAVARLLPSYLRPAAYEVLETLPLTTNGKLDAQRLPEPVFGTGAFRAPSGAAEERVAAVFAEVLETSEPVGTDDDFFTLGGTSLSATRVAARLAVSLRTLFDAPTVAELAVLVADTPAANLPELAAGPRPELVPLAPAQARLWLLNQLLPDSTAYHLPVAVRLTGALDRAALVSALAAVLDRHEVLRTVYPQAGNFARQHVVPTAQAVAVLDLRPREVAGDLAAELDRFAGESFDVAVDPPVRARLFRPAGVTDEHVLVLVAHHIAADGWSLGPLVTDLSTAYSAARSGTEPDWEPLPVDYADYTLWHRRLLGDPADPGSVAARQLAYWRTVLADAPADLPLPSRSDRPTDSGVHGAAVALDLAAPCRALDDSTPFMVAFAAYVLLLHRLSGRTDLVIGTPVAGRGHPALDRMVGMFVNTVPLRVRVDPDATFRELVASVRAIALDAFEHADIPFDQIIDAVDAPRVEGGHPLLRTVFSYENLPAPPPLVLDGLRLELLDLPRDTAQFDLTLTVGENPPRATFRYDTAAFDPADVELLVAGYRALLAAVTVDPDRPVRGLGDGRNSGEAADVDPVAGGTARGTVVAAVHPADPSAADGRFAPVTAREHAIAAVFAEVLGLDSVGPDDDFFALGGTSLLVFTLRTALADRLGLHVEPRALFAAATVRALASADNDLAPHRFAERLAADAELDTEFSVDGLAPADRDGPLLLTGATGFLGAHLLRDLLDSTSHEVYCLVRATDRADGLRRLRAALATYDLLHDDLPDRVTALPGDLARPRLGLDPDMFDALAGRLSAIVHNGALVNHLASYQQLRAANVTGTREVLRLAASTRAIPVHLVSTLDAVLGPDRTGHVDETTEITAAEVTRHGYGAGKWVAEQLVLRASERGLPVAVHRPGLVGASTRTGAVSAHDSLWTMIRSAALLGIAPEVGDAAVSLAPVDYVAAAITALVVRGVPDGQRYHLVNTEPTPVAELLAALVRLGYPMETVTPDHAQRILAERLAERGTAAGGDLARAALLIGTYLDTTAPGLSDLVLDDTRTRAALSGTGVRCPVLDDATIDRCLRRFQDTGLLPSPLRSTVAETAD